MFDVAVACGVAASYDCMHVMCSSRCMCFDCQCVVLVGVAVAVLCYVMHSRFAVFAVGVRC